MDASGTTTARIRLALEGATVVQQGLAKIEGGVSSVARSVIGLAGGLSVAGFATWIKGAINAADEASKLAQKAGLAVNQVAGLKLAFGQSGVSAEQFVPVMAKLGVAVTNGNKALTAMGIASHNADGSLKSTRQVLGEVSEKFAGYQDGAAKTALAVGLLGEEGAKLLPLLNQGAAGLDQYDQMAQQLGLTLDTKTAKAAEQFNDTIDLMGKATSGVATQVAARLLPTLNTLAGELFRSLVQGDSLNTVVDVLSGTMKGLYSVAVGVVTAFKTVGTALGGVGAAIASLISGDFAAVRTIISDMASDISASWSSAGASIIKVWEGAGDSTVSALAQATAAMQGAVPVIAQSTAAINKKTEADKKAAEAAREKAQAEKAAAQVAREEADIRLRILAMQDKASEVYANSADQVANSNQALREEIEAIGQTAAQRAQSIRLKEREILADKELELISLQNADADAVTLYNLQREIELRKQRLELLGQRFEAEDRAKLVAEWQKANEQITQSLTDSLFNGGKSFLDNLASYARTVVLRPIIAPIGAALGGLLGGGSAAAASGAAGGLGDASGLLGSVSQIAGLSSALGTGIAAGFANAITGTFAGSLSAAGSLIGTGTAAGVSAGVGMAIGTVAPYALAAYGVYKLLTAKTPGEQHQGGYYSSLGFTGLEGAARITGSGANSGQARDLIDRASPGLTSQVRTSVDAIVASVTGMAQTLGNQVALGLDLGFAANLNGQAGNKNAFGYFGVSANGQLGRTYQNRELGTDPAAAYQQLTTEAANALADVVLGNSGLVRAGESSLQTLTRLSTSLQGVNATLDTLGLRALAVGLAGGDAASQLADLFGGLQAFNTAAGAYYQAFYSEQERTATSTRQLTTALAAMGIALPQTRSAYRQLVEAQDLTTEAGRRTYASLLQLAPTFDQVAKAREQEATAAQALSQALQGLGDSITDEINRLRGLAGGNTTAQAYAALQGRFATTTAQARAGDQQALEALPGISQALEEAASLQASTASELVLIRQQLAASLQATLGAALGVGGLQAPALATGTNYVPHDMLIQAHRGEAVVPAAYNPAAGGALGGSAEAVAELRTLRDRLDRLIAAQGEGFTAVAGHTAKTARILERATPTGDAVLTMTQTDLDNL